VTAAANAIGALGGQPAKGWLRLSSYLSLDAKVGGATRNRGR